MFTHLRSVRLRSLHSGSLHITSLVFSTVDCQDDDAPGLSRCSGASGCSGPLLTPLLRIVLVAVDRGGAERSVTRSRSTSR
jgi:hypothetical protein